MFGYFFKVCLTSDNLLEINSVEGIRSEDVSYLNDLGEMLRDENYVFPISSNQGLIFVNVKDQGMILKNHTAFEGQNI
jgi:hypothetical protein